MERASEAFAIWMRIDGANGSSAPWETTDGIGGFGFCLILNPILARILGCSWNYVYFGWKGLIGIRWVGIWLVGGVGIGIGKFGFGVWLDFKMGVGWVCGFI